MQSCLSAFYDPYLEAPQEVPFCREDSLICSPISSLISSELSGPHEFCALMGFKVQGAEVNDFKARDFHVSESAD